MSDGYHYGRSGGSSHPQLDHDAATAPSFFDSAEFTVHTPGLSSAGYRRTADMNMRRRDLDDPIVLSSDDEDNYQYNNGNADVDRELNMADLGNADTEQILDGLLTPPSRRPMRRIQSEERSWPPNHRALHVALQSAKSSSGAASPRYDLDELGGGLDDESAHYRPSSTSTADDAAATPHGVRAITSRLQMIGLDREATTGAAVDGGAEMDVPSSAHRAMVNRARQALEMARRKNSISNSGDGVGGERDQSSPLAGRILSGTAKTPSPVPRTPNEHGTIAMNNMTLLPATPSFMHTQGGNLATAGEGGLILNSSSSSNSAVPVPPTAQKARAAQMTLKEQEKLLDEKTKECFNLKLKIDKLEDLLARLGPENVQNALSENVNLRLKIHEQTVELDRHRKLLLEARWAVETLQKQQAQNVSAPQLCQQPHRTASDEQREQELEAALAICGRELEDMRAEVGADDVSRIRQREELEALRHDAEQLAREVTALREDRALLEQALNNKEAEVESYREEAAMAQESLEMVDSLEQENRFLRDQVAELTLELRDHSDNANAQLDEHGELQEELDQLHELLEREREEASGRMRELEQSQQALLNETRNKLDRITHEHNELSYNLAQSEQTTDQLRNELAKITSERDQWERQSKNVSIKAEQLLRDNDQQQSVQNEAQLQELRDTQMRNEELMNICGDMDVAAHRMADDLDAANERINQLQAQLQAEADNTEKDSLIIELQAQLQRQDEKLARERTGARSRVISLMDERSALEKQLASMKERQERIQTGSRDYLEEIKTLRQTINRHTGDTSGVVNALDGVLVQLREKQQLVCDLQEQLRTKDDGHIKELNSLRGRIRKRDTWIEQALEQLNSINDRKGAIATALMLHAVMQKEQSHEHDAGAAVDTETALRPPVPATRRHQRSNSQAISLTGPGSMSVGRTHGHRRGESYAAVDMMFTAAGQPATAMVPNSRRSLDERPARPDASTALPHSRRSAQ